MDFQKMKCHVCLRVDMGIQLKIMTRTFFLHIFFFNLSVVICCWTPVILDIFIAFCFNGDIFLGVFVPPSLDLTWPPYVLLALQYMLVDMWFALAFYTCLVCTGPASSTCGIVIVAHVKPPQFLMDLTSRQWESTTERGSWATYTNNFDVLS